MNLSNPKAQPYRREAPKRFIPKTPLYLKKRGKRELLVDSRTGAVTVFRRRDRKIMRNSPLTREAR